MNQLKRYIMAVLAVAVVLAIALGLYALAKKRPQDLPWTPLDLGEKPGMFTGRKLAGLTSDFARCRALLDKAGVKYTPLPPTGEDACRYEDGVRMIAEGSRTIGFAPPRLGVSCPVAAAMAMMEWNVIQPAAQRHFGQRVTLVEHFGSYNCRRMYGRSQGDWSEHATADAIDLSGFILADGTRITVVRDWNGTAKDAAARSAFLRDIRDGACKLFSTVLSPDYNAAHRDHFHIDQAERGEWGGRSCR